MWFIFFPHYFGFYRVHNEKYPLTTYEQFSQRSFEEICGKRLKTIVLKTRKKYKLWHQTSSPLLMTFLSNCKSKKIWNEHVVTVFYRKSVSETKRITLFLCSLKKYNFFEEGVTIAPNTHSHLRHC